MGDINRPIWCPACAGRLTTADPMIMAVDRYGNNWPLARCGLCGVEFQVNPMPDVVRQEFYASGRYRQLCEQATGKPWTDRAYLETAQKAYARLWMDYNPYADRLFRMWPRGGRWLDYGGSTGVVPRVWLDGYDHSTTVIVADYGDGATTTPEQAWSLGPYNAILCCQTLDHLREPLTTLRQFKDVATPNARLFVDVVKLAHTDYKIDHDTYYPTASSFTSLVERAGWSILWVDCETNPTHYSILAEVA